MKIFNHFNSSGTPCPICGTVEDSPPVLIPIHGTKDDNICEALQVHLKCIELSAYRDGSKIILAMVVKEIKELVV